jgi:hypothetical protein
MHVVVSSGSYYPNTHGSIPASALGLPGTDMYSYAAVDIPFVNYVNKHHMYTDCPMGDEMNAEGAAVEAVPVGWKLVGHITTTSGDNTSKGFAAFDIHCVEALMQVEINITRDRFEDFKRYKILRHKHLTDEQRQEIADKAKDMIGIKYSVLRITLQLFDQIFNTDYFSRRIKDPEQQICSSLVAWCYDVVTGVRFCGKSWAAIEPDDIDDESLRYDSDFETILEWKRD